MSDDTGDVVRAEALARRNRIDHIDRLSEILDNAQTIWELIDWEDVVTGSDTLPCMECGGRGQVNFGVFGTVECPTCDGKKVILNAEAVLRAEEQRQSPFPALRAKLRAARLEVQNHPTGPLPMAAWEALPSVAELQKLKTDIFERGRQLREARFAGRLKAPGPGTSGDKLVDEHEDLADLIDPNVDLGGEG